MAKLENINRKSSLAISFYLILLLIFSISGFAVLTKKRQLLFFFDKIDVNGAVDVFLKPGGRNEEAFIFADSEVMNEIALNVRDRTLYIDANNTFDISRRLPFLKLSAQRTFPVEIIIHSEKLSEIRLNGKGNITVSDIRTPKLSVHTTGSGRFYLENSSIDNLFIRQDGKGPLVLKGKEVSSLELIVTGDGPIWAQSLQVDRARVSHRGKNEVQLNPLKFLDSRILGQGNIILHQKPSNIVVTQKGSGKVVDVIPDTPELYDYNVSRTQSPAKEAINKN